jgi:hypothetical protein
MNTLYLYFLKYPHILRIKASYGRTLHQTLILNHVPKFRVDTTPTTTAAAAASDGRIQEGGKWAKYQYFK